VERKRAGAERVAGTGGNAAGVADRVDLGAPLPGAASSCLSDTAGGPDLDGAALDKTTAQRRDGAALRGNVWRREINSVAMRRKRVSRT